MPSSHPKSSCSVEEQRLSPVALQGVPGDRCGHHRCCRITAEGAEGQLAGLLTSPLTLKAWHQLSYQEWIPWQGLAAREEAQSMPACLRSRAGVQASSNATAVPLACPQGQLSALSPQLERGCSLGRFCCLQPPPPLKSQALAYPQLGLCLLRRSN